MIKVATLTTEQSFRSMKAKDELPVTITSEPLIASALTVPTPAGKAQATTISSVRTVKSRFSFVEVFFGKSGMPRTERGAQYSVDENEIGISWIREDTYPILRYHDRYAQRQRYQVLQHCCVCQNCVRHKQLKFSAKSCRERTCEGNQ